MHLLEIETRSAYRRNTFIILNIVYDKFAFISFFLFSLSAAGVMFFQLFISSDRGVQTRRHGAFRSVGDVGTVSSILAPLAVINDPLDDAPPRSIASYVRYTYNRVHMKWHGNVMIWFVARLRNSGRIRCI